HRTHERLVGLHVDTAPVRRSEDAPLGHVELDVKHWYARGEAFACGEVSPQSVAEQPEPVVGTDVDVPQSRVRLRDIEGDSGGEPGLEPRVRAVEVVVVVAGPCSWVIDGEEEEIVLR